MLVGEKTHAPDLQMVERVHRPHAGDSEAFAELFQRLQPVIRAQANHIPGDRSTAEDIGEQLGRNGQSGQTATANFTIVP